MISKYKIQGKYVFFKFYIHKKLYISNLFTITQITWRYLNFKEKSFKEVVLVHNRYITLPRLDYYQKDQNRSNNRHLFLGKLRKKKGDIRLIS